MKVLNKYVFTILSLFIGVMAFGQEMLIDLNSNTRLAGYEDYKRHLSENDRAVGDTLDLPFFEDFSEPFSRLAVGGDYYPDSQKWVDDKVYINNHMGINPLSQGVATFDGLDAEGRAYGFVFPGETSEPSDSLTSRPIDLTATADTVYLSFYYQAQGLGNFPETEDSLVVEFRDTANVWQTAWKTPGYILEEYDFIRVMLPVLGEQYLYNGFQFRIRNYASRSGYADHWHVDYVELDDGRNLADTIVNDLAFLGQTSFVNDTLGFQHSTVSLLNEYANMPWDHFKANPNPEQFMAEYNYFLVRNNFDTIIRPDYVYRIYNAAGTQVFDDSISSAPIDPFLVCGNESQTCNLIQSSNFSFSTDEWVFPTDEQISEDSMRFLVKNLLLNAEDAYHVNDTSVFLQEFYNYYAYDDGTAEVAYGLGLLESVSKVVMRYDIKKADWLRAIQIYLNPVRDDLSNETVNLIIWSGNDEPEVELWRSADTVMYYTWGFNNFYDYQLDQAIWVEEGQSIFIGWEQQPVNDQIFSVGFDKRTDVSDKLFYNLGTNWAQSSIPGALMIRPTFGDPYDWVGVEENLVGSVSVFPNPTTGQLYLTEAFPEQFKNAQITIFDLTGRAVHKETGYDDVLNIQHLIAGTYILQVETESSRRYTQRIVLQP